MSISGDEIADVVLKEFEKWPSKRKPLLRNQGVKEWVPLSGIVAQGRNGLACLAVATGMKCLPQNKIAQAQGVTLHDWHAEILTIRSFNQFLLEECLALASSEKASSEYVRIRAQEERTDTHFQPFALNDGINLHMYCSEAPCGDSSMELTMAAQEDDTPWALPSEKDEDGVSPASEPGVLHGRGYFSALGSVRRKPSRPDAPPSLSKSCSDKIALKQSTSLLTSITSLLISPKNVYLHSLVLPSSQYSSVACTRAFSDSGRLSSLKEREFISSRRQPLLPGEKIAPSNIATSWTPNSSETLIGGSLQGRKQFSLKGASRVCKRRSWKLAFEIAKIASLRVPHIEKALNADKYGLIKQSLLLAGRRTVKADVRTTALKGWIRNDGGEVPMIVPSLQDGSPGRTSQGLNSPKRGYIAAQPQSGYWYRNTSEGSFPLPAQLDFALGVTAEIAEIDGPPSYAAIQNDGKPPAYSGPRIPSPEPGLIDRERLPYVPGQPIRYVQTPAPIPTSHYARTSRHELISLLTHPNGKKRRASEWFCMIICLCAFIGAIIGMGVGIKNRVERNRQRADKNDSVTKPPTTPPYTPPLNTSTLLDFAATECEAGTFVFHQDGNGAIWVQGQFRNAKSWNSSSMAPIQLRFDELSLLQKPANMTAVCWSVSELQHRIALYFVLPISYLDSTGSNYRYDIIESIVHIFDDSFTLGWHAVVNSNAALTTLSGPSSLTAVILPSTGVRLFYSEKSQGYIKSDIIELDRGWFELDPAFLMEVNTAKRLNADAYPSSPLTAAAVDPNDGTVSAEVHIFFIDSRSRLSRIVRSGSETYPEADLFFIENNEIQHILGAEIPPEFTASTAPFIYIPAPKSADYHGDSVVSFPRARQSPPLVAVTCWNAQGNKSMGVQASDGPDDRVRLQVFYVRFEEKWDMDYDRGEGHGNVTSLGMGIVKVTGRAKPAVGFVDDWEVPNDILGG
ncbi:hypothetical protein VTL71DRAFT_15340 [Oculimacula yallundae]|uniref:A to I editase domain-containing protein n=1 Tax=Oculimacula yallundae TaxID=86028 RepID=A0ABR4CHK9_9HELO